jgi:hypothetical protein
MQPQITLAIILADHDRHRREAMLEHATRQATASRVEIVKRDAGPVAPKVALSPSTRLGDLSARLFGRPHRSPGTR